MTTKSGTRVARAARCFLLPLVLPALAVPLVTASPPARAAGAARCFGEQATITASNRDTVRGTSGDDVIVVRGVFEVKAGPGDDLVCVIGAQGASVEAGPGDDDVDTRGSSGDPEVRLGAGNDRFLGGGTDDDVYDGDEDGPGRDVVRTGAGHDSVSSGAPRRTNRDIIDLGRDDDEAFLSGRPDGSVASGRGSRDTLYLSAAVATSWTVDLGAGWTTAGGTRARTTGFEHLFAGLPFTRLKVRGSDVRNKVQIIRAGRTSQGGVDVDLRGGNDELTAEGRLRGRVSLGIGAEDQLALFRRGGNQLRQDLTGSLATGLVTTAGLRLRVSGIDTLWVKRFDRVRLSGDSGNTNFVISGCRIVVAAGGGDDWVTPTVLPRRCSSRLGVVLHGQGGDDRLYGTQFADVLVGGAGHDRAYGSGGGDRCLAEIVRQCGA